MTRVTTLNGPIEGRERNGVLLFAGIPYAAPPTGPRRFRAPEPREAWRETLPCRRFAPAAPQVPTGGLTASQAVRCDEDCLSLNVCTPAVDEGRRPVLLWIHGGAYRTGQGAIPWYDGTRFALHGDLVVVSLNYRLGALGFTDLRHLDPALKDSGNVGLLDQIAALRWVRDNIDRFGGDPQRVTIAGESAGAFAVCSLLASPLAAGLFLRAIPQSGGGHHVLPADAGRIVAETLLEEAGCDGLSALQRLPCADLLEAQQRVIQRLETPITRPNPLGVPVGAFYPTLGGPVLPEHPLEALRGGAGADVAVLTGSNHDETTLWGYGTVDEDRLTRAAAQLGAASTLAVYRQTRPEADAEALLIALTTDHEFRIPAIRLAEARQGQPAGTWMYEFCWPSRAFGGRLKATHALEIPFVFDNLDKPGVDIFLGEGPPPQALAERMHEAWIRFIRDGDPGWPAYGLDHRRAMRFDSESTVVEDPQGAEREAWNGLR